MQNRECEAIDCRELALYSVIIKIPPLVDVCGYHLLEEVNRAGWAISKPICPYTPWPIGLDESPWGDA